MTQDEIEARGEFTPRTQGEIDRNLFAARTGALVTLSAGAAWELIYAAQAWHRHVKAPADNPWKRLVGELLAVSGAYTGMPDSATPQQAAVLFLAHLNSAQPVAHLLLEADDNESASYTAHKEPVEGSFPVFASPLAPQARDTTPSEDA